MPSTLIFGGSGKVARHLARILTAEHKPAHTVYSIIRNPNQVSELEALGAKPIVQSIEDSSVDDFVATIKETNPDYIVWSAGAGGGSPERTRNVDQEGAIKVMDAVAKAGKTKRFIIVSAIDVRDRDNKPTPEWYTDADKKRSDGAWGAIGAYMRAKLGADVSLRTENDRRGLRYTIVRPGSLGVAPGVGRVRAGKVGMEGEIPREDVARVVAAVIDNDKTIGLAFDVIGDGEGGLPVDQAVEKVAEAKVDTFEGHY